MVSAIILAAGNSQRMGRSNKLLLPWKKKPLIAHSVEAVLESTADEVLVIVGYQGPLIRQALQDYPLQFVENSDYAQGMLSSIQAGIHSASGNSQGWMICLGDQPRTSSMVLNLLLDVFRGERNQQKDLIVLPVCDGIRRNPVIFSHNFRESLLAHKGERAIKVVRRHEDCVVEVEVKPSRMFEDIDTPREYAALKG